MLKSKVSPSKSYTLKYSGIFLIIIFLFYCSYKINLNKQILNISKLIDVHYSGNGLVVGSFPLISLFIQLIENNGDYSVQELKLLNNTSLVFNKSFEKRKSNFSIANIIKISFSFKTNINGYIFSGKIIPSNIVLLNIVFISAILVVLVIFFFSFIKKFLYLKVTSYKVEMVEQICHDIRSPISVLNILSSKINFLNFEHKEIYLNALERISVVLNSFESEKKNLSINTSSQVKKYFFSIKNFFKFLNVKKKYLINVENLISNIVLEKKTIIKNCDIVLNVQVSSDLTVYVSKVELERVISNIINNAIEAIDKVIGVVNIDVTLDKGYLIISIIDNGVGIPDELINKIGYRGFSFGKNMGSGLGLWHAKKTIHNAKGQLIIESYSKKGTIVLIKLPLAWSSF